ncbi:MAG: DUF3109 family protein [Anaerolineaceae bacterium]|nr:DUF3109 family protein [Anaerolineaceae bacterium]
MDRLNPRMFKSEPMQRCKLHACKGACCLYGVWIDQREAADLLENREKIIPFMPAENADPVMWFDGREEDDEHSPTGRVLHSAVVPADWHYGGTACVFLRMDYRCALQAAGDAAGLHAWRFKPFYCILHPLDLDDEGRITLDETELMLDEEGSCLRPAGHPIPLLETFEEELVYLLGEKGYARALEERKQMDEK